MNKDSIYAKLTDIFRDLFDDETITLTPQTTAADIAGWDSFNHINLLVACESKFKVKFNTAEIESLHNVGHLVDVVALKMK